MGQQIMAAYPLSRTHFGLSSVMHYMHEGGEKETTTSRPAIHWPPSVVAHPWTYEHVEQWKAAQKKEESAEE